MCNHAITIHGGINRRNWEVKVMDRGNDPLARKMCEAKRIALGRNLLNRFTEKSRKKLGIMWIQRYTGYSPNCSRYTSGSGSSTRVLDTALTAVDTGMQWIQMYRSYLIAIFNPNPKLNIVKFTGYSPKCSGYRPNCSGYTPCSGSSTLANPRHKLIFWLASLTRISIY